MNSIKIFFFGILTLFVSNSFYGQEKQKIKTFVTPDSLAFIYLLPNEQFGYTSFQGYSPYTYKFKKNKGSIDGPYFIVNEHGSGKYSLHDNRLELIFIKPEHPVDSISRQFLETFKSADSLSIEIIIQPYTSMDHVTPNFGMITEIASKDNSVNANTMFENYARFKISKNQLPLELFINENYRLIVDKGVNQIIELFFNPYKMAVTDNIEQKTFDIKKLINIKTE